MKDLRNLWTTEGLILDTNNDGVPDGVNVEVTGLGDNCKPLGIIDFFIRMGLETTALSLPIIEKNSSGSFGVSLEIDQNKPLSICKINNYGLTLVGQNESQLSELLRWLASSWPYSLPEFLKAREEEIIEIGFNRQNYYVVFSSGEKSEWLTVANENAQNETLHQKTKTLSGLQDLWTTEGFFQSGRVDLNSQLDVTFQLNEHVSYEVLVKAAELAARIGLHSTGVRFPVTAEGLIKRNPEICFQINAIEEARCDVTYESHECTNFIKFYGGSESVARALTYFATAKPFEEGGDFGIWEQVFTQHVPQTQPLLLQKEWEDSGEKKQLETILSNWINGVNNTDEQISIVAFVSEPENIRKQLAVKYESLLAEKSKQSNVLIRSAYKPGYFWLEEEVIPLIKSHGKRIGKITIACQEEKLGGLELSNRWIQEMYPVDLLLAEQLHLSSDDVQFELAFEQESTYVVAVYDDTNHQFVKATLSVPVSEMDYIDKKQKVYPTTGSIQFYRNGKLEKHEKNPTDRERFWSFFTEAIIPEMTSQLPLGEKGRGRSIPFFSRLVVDVTMSEEERRLGFDEERISSLEALHEDIYFDTLDYFEYLGEERVGEGWNAPGGIQPFMHVQEGVTPKANIEMYGFNPSEEQKVVTDSLTFNSTSIKPTKCCVRILKNGKDEAQEILQKDWEDIQLPEWDYELKELEGLPGISIWLGGVSYEGRQIPVVELTKQTKATHNSAHKLSLYKPTIFVEAGHHANEVSSMPAIRELLKEIATNQNHLLDKLNLVVVPSANPDGVNLHQRMAKDNPEWKHHAARYNAVGLEYAQVRFEKTIFGEADVVPKVIHRWLPDVVIDDHGIPSHEWVQPFAGFNSPPRFPVSYWMPNSLIYGLARQLNSEDYPEHFATLNKILDNIAKTVHQDREIKEKNAYWRKRFEKYGTNWLPEVFPIEETKDMIFYRWNKSVDRYSKAYIYRYPEWCTADLISETADETVYGEALTSCIKAHQLFNLGVIELVAAKTYGVGNVFKDGYIKYVRKRPLEF